MAGMEEREQRLVHAMVDLEDSAAGLRAHYDGIWRDVDAERMSLSHERQELLNLWAQLSISPKEVTRLRASIVALEAQVRTREEGVQKQLMVVNELLAASSARVSALEGDLQTTTTSLETLGGRVVALEVALGDAHKLLEVERAEGQHASKARLNLEAQVEANATNLRQTVESMAQALAELRLLPSLVPAGPVSEIALWYADVLKKLGALPRMLKQRLTMEGERIVEIIGFTILPHVHHLAPSFPFPRHFEGFGDTKEGNDARDTAKAVGPMFLPI
jgi:hypothetical protein